MAKKIDLSKIDLSPRKPLKKKAQPNVDEAVRQIHTEEVAPVKPKREVTKRVTLDIPLSLHRAIKRRVFDSDKTMKEYFLELAQLDLKNQLL